MKPHDELEIDLAAARYLEALMRDDFDEMDQLWRQAALDPRLLAAFQEVHEGLIEESETAEITAAAAKHLKNGEIIPPTPSPVTVADVADDLFRHTPELLPAAAIALNEKLRTARVELPEQIGLGELIAWAEPRFGAAPKEYWKSFRNAAVKLRVRQGVMSAEYELAARRQKFEG